MREDRFWEQDTVVDKYVEASATYQMTTRDYVVRVSTTSGGSAFTLTLPPVVEARGRTYSVLMRAKNGVKNVTIAHKGDSEYWGGDYILMAAGNRISFYSDGMTWQPSFSALGVFSTKTVIGAAAVKTLRATPVELVPAIGADLLIEFLSATLILDYGSEVLAESADNLAVKYTNGSGVAVSDAVEMTGFIDQEVDMVTRGVPIKDAIVALSASANKALILHNTGDGEMTGNASDDSVLTVFTLFRVVNNN